MTKQLRKGLMTVLLFVMAIVCAFSASTLFARADATTLTEEEQFVADVTAIVTAADVDGTAGISEDEVRALVIASCRNLRQDGKSNVIRKIYFA